MAPELLALFDCYPARFRPVSPPESLGNAGGLSGAKLWRYVSPSGQLVARAWPPEKPDPDTLARIHGWLDEIRDLDFIPEPLPGLDGRTFRRQDDRLWEIAPWKPGSPDRDRPPRPERLRAGVITLGLVHDRLAHHRLSATSPGLASRLREIEDLRLGGFDRIDRAVRGAPRNAIAELSSRWLAAARGLVDRVSGEVRIAAIQVVPLQPCLRDIRPDHFLFEGDRLTGLVDFGAMGVESVAADLARLLSEWVGEDRSARADVLETYRESRPLSAVEADLIGAFEASSSLLIGGHWIRWHFLEGRRFDDPMAVLDGLRRGLDRIAGLVRLDGSIGEPTRVDRKPPGEGAR